MNIINACLKYNEALIRLDLNKIKYIILHHAEAVQATPNQIHAWHLQNGWAGAGYNYYVRKDGTVYEMRGNNVGAHTQSYNSVSIGICCEGNYDTESTMPDKQYSALVELIKMVKMKYPNTEKIGGHRDFNATACPGKYFPLNDIINSVSDDFLEAIKKLSSEGFIGTPDYWLKNCTDGKLVKSEYLKKVILKYALDKMQDEGIINSPNYWEKCMDGSDAAGEYVRKLLGNMAERI